MKLLQVKQRMQADMEYARLRGFAKVLLYNEDQVTRFQALPVIRSKF